MKATDKPMLCRLGLHQWGGGCACGRCGEPQWVRAAERQIRKEQLRDPLPLPSNRARG